MIRVLVVDDVPAVVEQYAYDLERIGGYDVLSAGDGRAALDLLTREPVDCMILDLEMPGMDGFELLRTLSEKKIELPVIVYTGTGDYDRCVEAVRLGAFAFIDKSEPMERVVREVENALERQRLVSEVSSLRRRLGGDSPLIGSSAPMDRLREQIERVAPIPSPVLVLGESGSGKELVAREIHRASPGAKAPFVAVNSAALPENLVESELFGHERGAFTGAHRLHRGAFESAGEGTIFLDEIGDLPGAAQAKLLRVLEQRELTRVGGERPVQVRARVVAATHRDLEAAVESGDFRKDLYFRVCVHVLQVPPLRERLSDVAELASHFLDTICERFGVRRKGLDDEALGILMRHPWDRNNVRELRNAIERMVIACEGDLIGARHVPADIRDEADDGAPTGTAGTFRELKAEAERRILVEALERNDWHITNTAAELGLADHSSLLKIMRRHNLSRD